MMTNPEMIEITERLVVAVLIGAAIGIHRHLHDQPAGLRTHGLVALAAALAVLVVAPIPGSGEAAALDAQSRVLQGVMTGVGFIGAGVILHAPRHQIHGLTTAAAIWITAAFGALCGHGRLDIAGIGFVMVVLVLAIGEPIENYIHEHFKRPARPEDEDKNPPR